MCENNNTLENKKTNNKFKIYTVMIRKHHT